MIGLPKLKELALAATPGPWFQCMATVVGAESVFVADLVSDQHQISPEKINRDGRFIAAVNPTVVLAVIERLERAEEALAYYSHPDHYEERITMCGTRPPGVLADRGKKARVVLGDNGKYSDHATHEDGKNSFPKSGCEHEWAWDGRCWNCGDRKAPKEGA